MTPALRERLDEHRRVRHSELIELAALLDSHGLTPDTGPLRDAASLTLSAVRTAQAGTPDAGRTYWGYRIDGLQLRLEEQRHCRPRATRATDLVGVLSVDVEEYVPAGPDRVGDSYGHIRRLEAQFRCDAHAVIGDEIHSLRAAWHVDTHLHTATQGGAAHPRFHFQVGGHDLADVDHAIRGAFLLDAPRPALAPLDGVLAIDFVLSHYCGTSWEYLRLMEARYGRIRATCMRRYWRPYFRLIADALETDGPVGPGTPAALLLPNLLTQ